MSGGRQSFYTGALRVAESANSRGDVERACSSFIREHGATHFHLVSARPQRSGGASVVHGGRWQLFDCHNGPAEWVMGLEVEPTRCPLLETFLSGSLKPIAWDRERFAVRGALRRFTHYEAIDCVEGICVASPRGDRSLTVLTVGGPKGVLASEGLLSFGALFVTLIAEAAERHLPHGLARRDAGELSPREVECLTMLALGNSTAETGEHLAVSSALVDRALRSAREKLGVPTTFAAVAMATKLELIDLP